MGSKLKSKYLSLKNWILKDNICKVFDDPHLTLVASMKLLKYCDLSIEIQKLASNYIRKNGLDVRTEEKKIQVYKDLLEM